MASNDINDSNKLPIHNAYTNTTAYNAEDAHIKRKIDEYVNTAFIARIDECDTADTKGSTTVNATPLIAQTDAKGNALDTPSYRALAHSRLQSGIAGIIINPVKNDIGVFVCPKSDSANIKQGTNQTQVPASFRRFSVADAVQVGTIYTQDPTVYIELTQDNIINIVAPKETNVTSPKIKIIANTSIEVTAPQITINGDIQVNGTISCSGDIKSGDISMQNHVHGNVRNGDGVTSKAE